MLKRIYKQNIHKTYRYAAMNSLQILFTFFLAKTLNWTTKNCLSVLSMSISTILSALMDASFVKGSASSSEAL